MRIVGTSGSTIIMACMTKELRIDLGDLECIVIQCPACQTQIRLGFTSQLGRSNQAPAPLEWCPGCQTNFGSSLRNTVEALRQNIDTLKGLSASVGFQITAPMNLQSCSRFMREVSSVSKLRAVSISVTVHLAFSSCSLGTAPSRPGEIVKAWRTR